MRSCCPEHRQRHITVTFTIKSPDLVFVRPGVVEDDGGGVGPDAVLAADPGVGGTVQAPEGDLASYHGARLPELREEVHTRRTPGSEEVDHDGLAGGDEVREVGTDEGLHRPGLGGQPGELHHVLHVVLPVVELEAPARFEEGEAGELVDVKISADLGQLSAVQPDQPLSGDEGGDLLVDQVLAQLSVGELDQPGGPHVSVQPPPHLSELRLSAELGDLRHQTEDLLHHRPVVLGRGGQTDPGLALQSLGEVEELPPCLPCLPSLPQVPPEFLTDRAVQRAVQAAQVSEAVQGGGQQPLVGLAVTAGRVGAEEDQPAQGTLRLAPLVEVPLPQLHHAVRQEGDQEVHDLLLLLPALELDCALVPGEEVEAGVARDPLLATHHELLLTVDGAHPDEAGELGGQPAPERGEVVTVRTAGGVEVDEPDI